MCLILDILPMLLALPLALGGVTAQIWGLHRHTVPLLSTEILQIYQVEENYLVSSLFYSPLESAIPQHKSSFLDPRKTMLSKLLPIRETQKIVMVSNHVIKVSMYFKICVTKYCIWGLESSQILRSYFTQLHFCLTITSYQFK